MIGRETAIHARNYSLVMALLGFSQAKLEKFGDKLDELVYQSRPVTKSQLKSVLGASDEEIEICSLALKKALTEVSLDDVVSLTIRDDCYPDLLKQINRPPQVLFTRGNLDLLKTDCVSVVGSREVSREGVLRAQKIAIALAANGYTLVSGLARGVDTAAQTATIKAGGKTIAVIGTPIHQAYPRENTSLQNKIAEGHLLVSQFPPQQPVSKFNFPQRNYTMCGLSWATVIVEASETSGALYQARACIQEKRKLFIMKSLLENKLLKWPRTYVEKGALVLKDTDELLEQLAKAKSEQPSDNTQLTLLDIASG
jgi:DNA processing protein